MPNEVISIFAIVREFIYPVFLVLITAFVQMAFKNINLMRPPLRNLNFLNEINNSKLDKKHENHYKQSFHRKFNY